MDRRTDFLPADFHRGTLMAEPDVWECWDKMIKKRENEGSRSFSVNSVSELCVLCG
jgi:hypothetical protein